MVCGVIVAGGVGRRMGAALPKQFLALGEQPVIIYSVQQFLRAGELARIIVAVPPDYIQHTKQLLAQHGCDDRRLEVIAGGDNRGETIMNALEALQRSYKLEGCYIITHDAVRPFVSEEMITAHIDAVQRHGAVNTVIPATDTIVSSDDGLFVASIPERERLYIGQTPQSFSAALFSQYYKRLTPEQAARLTDGCGLFARFGHPIFMVEGSVQNIKITTPTDMRLAQLLLQQQE